MSLKSTGERCLRRVESTEGPCLHYIKSPDPEPGFCRLPGYFRCLEAVEHYTPRLSHSQIQTWMRCPFKYYLSEILGVRIKNRVKSIPLKIGTVWDAMLNNMMEVGGIDMVALSGILAAECVKVDIDDKTKLKLWALVRAMKDLGICIPKAEPQHELRISFPDQLSILGYLDGREDAETFCENKLSGRPAWYDEIFNLHDQLGTYFMMDENLKRCKVRVTRFPDLRSTRRNDDESDESHAERTYADIMGRPAFYFNRFKRGNQDYGRVFYREEFDVEEMKHRAICIARDIQRAVPEGGFYMRRSGCLSPGECEYIPICKSGGVSDSLYYFRSYDEETGKEIQE